MQPWESAQPVDAARAAELVYPQFPSLAGAPVREVATGWDNSVLLVGDVLFRFPRRPVAVELQQRELAVLPLVAPVVPLQVPVPTHLGRPADGYPWPFWGAPMVRGAELAVVQPVDRTAAAEQAGAFLRALHDLEVALDLPLDPSGRAAPSLRRQVTSQWLEALRARGLWDGSAEVDALLDSPLGPSPEPAVLVHGDLHLRHLLVDGRGTATGVIDWGDTCFADPSVDLALAYAAFDGPARAAMLAAYGPVGADREERARVLAVSLCAAIAVAAAAQGESELLPEYLRGIERAVE